MVQKTLAEGNSKGKKTSKAHEMAKKQRSISVAEFFEKNRHLLGFDNKRKALLTTIKEAVDNSLDACEEARILPEISVEIIDMNNERFRIIVEDNGPGIVKKQIPMIFAKLLYGSKFHSLKQSRGQQGIGISAAALYGQLTTGKPIRITSKIHKDEPAHYYELFIDTKTNTPKIIKEEVVHWSAETGTRIELDMDAIYQKGQQSVDTYIKQTAIVNPHCTIIYTDPKANQIIFPRATDVLPKEAKSIKPHPHGVELGMLIKMIESTDSRSIQSFLHGEFSRVSSAVAKEVCEKAKILPNTKPSEINRDMSERILKAIQNTKIMAPPTDCITPIGSNDLERGLKKEIKAEFYCATTRPPSVYRGNPFVIECAIAYGGDIEGDKQVKIMRFANRVPLQLQQGACACTDSVMGTAWKNYGLQQSRRSIPVGPAIILVHMSSVWVPFTSEAKEALAHYPEIIKEMKLALQECGRKLAKYTSKKRRMKDEMKKRGYIEKYIPHVADALKKILSLKETDEKMIEENLKDLLEQSRGKLKDIKADNQEYDEDFAKIGEEEPQEEEKDE
ncbi:DNA topoisomerase VI subunit B [Candidatus Woesearchaeota archaeon]|jgi:DNA topoisomerase VI subunit B|nr:DNA topoisomerase VI subunit B [Candidatus Woesearchaeota archaeon]MBT3537408.1 DNA topoisomerase VI subunit B [Candidatus Woesearchaeota archaeon]MBT4697791.1 DNA topoisomerase VI subunit B [Candidatus Woesearchaeota archaeon]MBT4717522.1 DNA topoisomerase VI subunit B [Candidatus Woesearchaeota archaeon]MBT7106282.1 DNA topoisomerase VI subunit B [Candidatus Woesearchaeota archaeon]